jgi:hypothetical protein
MIVASDSRVLLGQLVMIPDRYIYLANTSSFDSTWQNGGIARKQPQVFTISVAIEKDLPTIEPLSAVILPGCGCGCACASSGAAA